MSVKANRPGFSLPEVLVATVLLGIIGGALTKLVVDQMRFFDKLGAVRGARSVARSSMNVVLSDLRMVQDQNGVIQATTAKIQVRVPYRSGLFCGTASSVSSVSMLPVDSAVLANAKYAGYAWRSRTLKTYTVPTITDPVAQAPALLADADATVCTTTAKIKKLTLNARAGEFYTIAPTIVTTNTSDRGAAVFFYQTITYEFKASTIFPGTTGLWRTVANGGSNEELMAPFASSSGFRYYLAGADASTATIPADLNTIVGVEVVLNAVGTRTPAGSSSPPQQKMVSAVFFKNVR